MRSPTPSDAPIGLTSRRKLLGAGAVAAGSVTVGRMIDAEDAVASTITGYYNVKDAPYSAAGNGSTDDTAAVQSALTAAGAGGGGVVYFPPGVYRISTAVSGRFLDVPDKVTVLGAGIGATRIKGPEGWNAAAKMFRVTGASTAFDQLTIEMPDSFVKTAGTQLRGIELVDSAEAVFVRRVHFKNLTYGMAGWAGSTQKLEVVDSLFTGTDVSSTFDAMGVIVNGAPGSQVILRGCEFRGLGSLANPNAVHGLYLGATTALLAEQCRFYDHQDGRYIQWYGDDYVGSGPAEYAIIDSCYFDSQATPNTGLQTCPTVATTVTGCTFRTQYRSIHVQGKVSIIDCVFLGSDAGDFFQIEPQAGCDTAILIDGCQFLNDNYWDIDCGNDGGVELVVRDTRFASASKGHVQVAGTAGTRNTSVEGCVFTGQNGAEAALRIGRGNRVEARNNNFRNAGAAIVIASGAGVSSFHVAHNDFSQAGASLTLASVPTSWRARDNFGSTGYASESGGTTSVADGGSISHGLGSAGAPIAPTRFSLQPRVAKRIAGVTAVSSTALTVSLHTDAGGSSGAVNVAWWAGQ